MINRPSLSSLNPRTCENVSLPTASRGPSRRDATLSWAAAVSESTPIRRHDCHSERRRDDRRDMVISGVMVLRVHAAQRQHALMRGRRQGPFSIVAAAMVVAADYRLDGGIA
jgi:hypothetical protein